MSVHVISSSEAVMETLYMFPVNNMFGARELKVVGYLLRTWDDIYVRTPIVKNGQTMTFTTISWTFRLFTRKS